MSLRDRMAYIPWIHHRRSYRLAGYDYTSPGAYFVTVCAHRKRCGFGRVVRHEMRLNRYGRIVQNEWCHLAEARPQVALDEFRVMPNHFHALLIITAPGTPPSAATPSLIRKFGDAETGSLSTIVGQFKANVTKAIHTLRAELYPGTAPVRVWQGRFYDHIVRDEDELNGIRRYIIENPQHWSVDQNYVP